MPTIISHAILAPALRRWFGRAPIPAHLIVAGAVAAMLPDLDVIGFTAHVPYGSTFGHRGFTHSIVFAVLVAAVAAITLRRDRRAFVFVFLCTLSHPLLDALTNGGLGVAFFSPFSNHRYFFPWRPIEVSPIGRFDFSVFASELRWIWLPSIVAAVMARIPQSVERNGRGSGDSSTGPGRR